MFYFLTDSGKKKAEDFPQTFFCILANSSALF